jgi:hypothetical protein
MNIYWDKGAVAAIYSDHSYIPLQFRDYILTCIYSQRAELLRITERHGYNFQHPEVLHASVHLDFLLNLYDRNCNPNISLE